ncbi:MAG: DUF2970 domain-containing protein [Burkholderiales bacterium]
MNEKLVRKAGFGQIARAVIWSFLGIRKRSEHESDVARITPVQAIIAGIIGAALFVLTILVVVRIVMSNVTT